ncbi:MAG: exo-alpha-sialidase [Chloroflexi bacterium]|nr:exo-alpha-sialidase [Chloroflexota bacterium]
MRCQKYKALIFTLLMAVTLGLWPAGIKIGLAAAPDTGTGPLDLSSKMESAASPEIVTDGQGLAYVCFVGSDLSDQKDSAVRGKYQNIYYQPLSTEGKPGDGGPFNVAVSPTGADAFVHIQADSSRNLLHMLFRSQGSLFYQQAPLDRAVLPVEWSAAHNLDDYSLTYSAGLAVDSKGIIHTAWVQQDSDSLNNQQLAVMYRKSQDRGKTWSFPKKIGQSKFMEGQLTLKIDAKDGLHLTWEDMDANQPDQFGATFGIYARSEDSGETWSKPQVLNEAGSAVYHLTMTPFGSSGNNLLAVWRNQDTQELIFIVSANRGVTWTKPQSVTGFYLPPLSNDYNPNEFVLGADNLGRVELVVQGTAALVRKFEDLAISDLSIYLGVWENNAWKKAEIIFQPSGYGADLSLALGKDRLHLAWTERDKFLKETPGSVQYGSISFATGFVAQAPVSPVAPTPKGVTTQPPPTPVTAVNNNAVQADPPARPTVSTDEPTAEWIKTSYLVTGLALVPLLGGFALLGIFVYTRRKKRQLKK